MELLLYAEERPRSRNKWLGQQRGDSLTLPGDRGRFTGPFRPALFRRGSGRGGKGDGGAKETYAKKLGALDLGPGC